MSRLAPVGTGPRVLVVGDLTRLIRDTIRGAPRLARVWVEGEVGQVTVSSAGHCYFTLKDERAQLRCMVFRDDRLALPLEPRTGLRVIANGRLDVFEPQGAYQLYVESLQPAGVGDLALRFEALKARLTAEGLFDATRKRPLPRWPRTHRRRHLAVRRGPPRHAPRHRPPLAPGAHRRERLPGAGPRCRGVHRAGAAPPRPLDRPGHGPRRGRRHRGPRRRLARGPVGLQRGVRRARHRRASAAGRGRRGPRDGRDAGGVRG